MDANLPFQQTLGDKPFAVMILRSKSNCYEKLRLLVPEILVKLADLSGSQLVWVQESSNT